MRTDRIEFRFWIPLLIGIAPALGYSLAYVYQLGYCEVYHIPFDLIHLDMTTILTAIAASLLGLAILAWFIFLILTIPLYISTIRKKVYFSLFILFFLGILAFFYLTIEETKLIGIMYVLLLCFIFIAPWLTHKFPRKKRRQDIPLNRLMNNKYFQYGFIAVYLVALILCFGYLAGRSNAMNKEIFYVPSSNPELVVLKIYDDNIICGKLVQDQESKMFGIGSTINLLKLQNISNVTFTPIKVKISFTQYPK